MVLEFQCKVNNPQQSFLFGISMARSERYRFDNKGHQFNDGGVSKLDIGILFFTFSLLFIYDTV